MSETTSRMVEATFKAPQVSDWERLRPIITRLYQGDVKTLKDVVSILREQHGFHATPRQYKQRIKAWSLQKNHKSEEMEDLLRHYTREELQDTIQSGSDSSIVLDGRRLSRSLLQRYLRRMRPSATSADCSTSSSPWPRSDNLISDLSSTLPHRNSKCDKPAIINDCSQPVLQSGCSTSSAKFPRHVYRGSQNSGSCEIPSAGASSALNEPSTAATFSYEDKEEESDARRKRRKISATNTVLALETKPLACPFYKHNPGRYNPQNSDMGSAMRYRTCAGPGWESISRLRQHLFRAHVAPKQCEVCNSVLQSHNDLVNHVRDCPAGAVTDGISAFKTMSEEEQCQLKRKQLPGLSREESWIRIYRILFPHDSGNPSPYYQTGNETSKDEPLASSSFDRLGSLIQHICNTLPEKILMGWQGQPKSQENSTRTGSQCRTSRESTHMNRESSQRQVERLVESHISNEPPLSHSAQTLRALISKSVMETCTDWMRIQNEQDGDSIRESDDDNDQSHSTSTLTSRQSGFQPSATTVPEYWKSYPEPQRDQACAYHADLSIQPSNFHQQIPSVTPWITLPQPAFPVYRFPDLSTTYGSNLESDTAAHSALSLSSSRETQSMEPFAPLHMTASSGLDGPGFAFGSSCWPDTSTSICGPWDQTQMRGEVAITLPEPNQDP